VRISQLGELDSLHKRLQNLFALDFCIQLDHFDSQQVILTAQHILAFSWKLCKNLYVCWIYDFL